MKRTRWTEQRDAIDSAFVLGGRYRAEQVALATYPSTVRRRRVDRLYVSERAAIWYSVRRRRVFDLLRCVDAWAMGGRYAR